jgi:putative two-component system response regulator
VDLLLALPLPDADLADVCRALRDRAGPRLKVLVVGGPAPGADDCLAGPVDVEGVRAAAGRLLRLKEAEDWADRLAGQFRQASVDLQESLQARAVGLRQAHDALLFTVAKLAELGDGETPSHFLRLREYTATLARAAAAFDPWKGLVDDRFLDSQARCLALHDIGKIGLPDDVLLKPASLTRAERALVETHPLIGDRILDAVAREHGHALDFLGMARSIVRNHHERWDGHGYPDGLKGEAIPPAARLLAAADVYDALRRMRMYKPAMSHSSAIKLMLGGQCDGQFDPALRQALSRCHARFEKIYAENEE